MTYILYLITLFAFIVSLIAAVYYFRKYNKIPETMEVGFEA